MKFLQYLNEIQTLADYHYTGGQEELKKGLWRYAAQLSDSANIKLVKIKNNLFYTILTLSEFSKSILIFDQTKSKDDEKINFHRKFGELIAELNILKNSQFPIQNTYKVSMVTVDENYRGQNLGLFLYEVCIQKLGINLQSDSSQTPAGKKMWLKLINRPNIEVLGWVSIYDVELDEHIIETLLGKIGAQYIEHEKTNVHYFWFEVKPGKNIIELQPKIKTQLTKLYDNPQFNVGLLARAI